MTSEERDEIMRLCLEAQERYPGAVRWIQARLAESDGRNKRKTKKGIRLQTARGERVELDAEWVREHRERSETT